MNKRSTLFNMGNSKSSALGAHTTAKQIVELYGKDNYLTGKTAIVTGGNSGIGLETCKALASAGCKVILCTRSIAAGNEAVASEIRNVGHGGYTVSEPNIVVKELDLNSLPSIKTFADDFLATEERIDYMILNAGIMALPALEYTEAGFEKQIGVNHYGHFYLMQLLLQKIKNTPDTAGRVVVLSSSAHSMGTVDPSDLNFKKGRFYNAWSAYGQSKAANLLFAKSLAEKLNPDFPHITAVSVHPGVIKTNLWRQSFMNQIFGSLGSSKSIPQGAATTLWAALSPDAGKQENRGAYLSDCAPLLPSTQCQDVDGKLREALWVATESDLKTALVAKSK